MTSPLDPLPFSVRLRTERRRRGYSQAALARALQRPCETVEAWEQGVRVPHRDIQAYVLMRVRRLKRRGEEVVASSAQQVTL